MTQAMISIHPETKRRLVRLQAELMRRKGSRVIFDETLIWLLDNSKV